MISLGSGNNILTVEQLTVAYDRSPVLSGLSLSLPRGAFFALFGQNGSGKSTLLKAIAGLLPASTGTIRFNDQPIEHLPSWKRFDCGIHILLQSERVFPEFDVYTNVEMGGYLITKRKERDRRVMEVLASTIMFKGRYRTPASSLSGGEQQVVALLRTLVMKPKLLLLDEPSTGLAFGIQERIASMLKKLHADGMTIVMAEQNVDFAKAITSNFLELKQGVLSEVRS